MEIKALKKMDVLHAKSFEFISRINKSHEIIKEALKQMKNPYISFSGGKDSTVMLHMILKFKPDIPVIYWDADASYLETEKFITDMIHDWKLNFIRRKTESMMSVFRKYGVNHPQIEQKTMIATVYNPIKELIKDYNFDGVFVGLRSQESRGRANLIKNKGQIFYNKSQKIIECLPVGHLTVEDIWAYITWNNLKYNQVYDRNSMLNRNEIRVSYWCGESCRERGRWVWLKKEYPDLYNKFASEFPEVRNFI